MRLVDMPEYHIWIGMRYRCNNPKSPGWKKYGGRGIKVCVRWDTSFMAFLSDMGKRPSDEHQLDRFPDNNGDYQPGNCRWATRLQQARNTRQNRVVTFRGEALSVSEWAERVGISKRAMLHRLDNDWPLELALTRGKYQKKVVKRSGSSRYRGVGFHKATGKWAAHIKINGKQVHLGVFSTEAEARDAYAKRAAAV